MKILKKTGIVLSVIVVLLIIIVASMVTTLDRTPYKEMSYYREWKKQIGELGISSEKSGDTLKVGWAKENITPEAPVPLAGYGARKGKSYDAVHDSIYVRTFFFQKGKQKIAIVSADLLILPPTVKSLVEKDLDKDIHVYYGAIHSHNSIGAWYNTLVGRLFAGKYDPEIESFLAQKILLSIKKAGVAPQNAEISFFKDVDTEDIRNRLVEGDPVEPFIRSLEIKTAGKKAILCTYAAHATVLNSKTTELSRDYPGVLVDALEKDGYDFAMYMSGAVASMGPIEKGTDDFDEVAREGQHIKTEVLSENEKEVSLTRPDIRAFEIELPLRKPSPRISQTWALRPWVFRWIFGDSPAHINVVKIGSVVMVGLPCDFSGELMKPLDEYASRKGLNLIITSFNGGYAGYITADNRFDMDAYETITMSWFGPYNGAYFSEAVRDVIDKVAASD
jgi:neutral ceramidase